MRQQRPSIDGFVPRRSGTEIGKEPKSLKDQKVEHTQTTDTGLLPSRDMAAPVGLSRSGLGIARGELDESLKSIDIQDPSKDKKQRHKKAPKSKIRRIIKWVIIILITAAVIVGAWVVYKTLNASNQIFKGSILDIVQNQPLKQDANGRSNILVLGTSEDDPKHDAPWLTDSIMVLSVDQNNKNAYMVSIPRDLEVQYGQSCMTGNRGKINVYYNCVGGGEGNTDADRTALMKEAGFIGGILGLDIQYGVNVNYTVMRELVNAVDGITVNIEGSGGAPGVMDSNFDWKCGEGDPKVSRAEQKRRCPPNGHFIDYPNGPAVLDAEHALYLAQARGDRSPTYGLGRSNFDRELNQQKIVKAIREKAMSAGVLTNFGKVTGIIDAIGNNLRTTFEAKEVKTLVDLAKDIKDQDIQSISLIDGDNAVMNGNAQPKAGLYQYSDIQALIKKKLNSNPVTREEANIVVLNGSGTAGAAKTESDKLAAQGFIISAMDNAPAAEYSTIEVYQLATDKPATKSKLESIYGVTVKTTKPPVAVAEGTSFIVIVGKTTPAN